MEPIQLLLVIVAIVIAAETTYLVAKAPRQTVNRNGRPIFVDTSVLIDGRIVAVARSGFIGDTLVIPRSVIGELQFLADNADHDKRSRARFGLDVVSELQGLPDVKVEILQDGSKAEEGVDERLLVLAKKYHGAVCTIDYNLNKVAVVENITVLNVNELAQQLRMAYLPGEHMVIELVQKGQDSHQGVGYLNDGTMVVVEHASSDIGKTLEVECIRSLQTAAGKMIFARKLGTGQQPRSNNDRKKQTDNKPAGRKAAKTARATTATVAASQSTSQSQPKRAQSKRRPKSQAQREADFIDLVNS